MWLQRIDARATAGLAPLALLSASIVLMVILAWQAVVATRSHRALAERVLRDYATFAAVEFVRRTDAFVDNYGFAVVIRALVRAEAESGGALPSHDALVAAIPAQSRGAEELVCTIFRFTADGSHFETLHGELPAEVRDAALRWARRP